MFLLLVRNIRGKLLRARIQLPFGTYSGKSYFPGGDCGNWIPDGIQSYFVHLCVLFSLSMFRRMKSLNA